MYLQTNLVKYFSPSLPLFNQVMALRGECFRHQEGRLTQRVMLGEKAYFIKQHTGIGWKEVLKNLLQGRLPVLSAKSEWRAIKKLQSAGIAVPTIVGYGQQGHNPAYLKSFILMEELSSTVSLEDLSQQWQVLPPSFSFKKKLILEVARIARTMHTMGMNHRDFYICHFLLSINNQQSSSHMPLLYLIDLHRAQIRKQTPKRWRIKDLAGLYFSSKNSGLTTRDVLRFIRAYRAKPLRDIFQTEKNYWQKIKNWGEQLYREHGK